jgi:hypothetical protein
LFLAHPHARAANFATLALITDYAQIRVSCQPVWVSRS